MIEVTAANKDKLPISGILLFDEAAKRGWRMRTYVMGDEYYQLERPDGKTLEFFMSLPSTTSGVATLRADDKYMTQQLLEMHNFPTLEVYRIDEEMSAEAVPEHFNQLFNDGRRWVVKPLNQAHGYGVTTNIEDTEGLRKAVIRARSYASITLLQEYYGTFTDLRVTCINGNFAAAVIRVPARVRGDGTHTIKELIDKENRRNERGSIAFSMLIRIDEESAELHLGDKLQDIPPAGQWQQVSGVANISMGGESVEVTNRIPAWLREMAEKASKVAQLPVCGVDFLLATEPRVDASQEELQSVILELNKAPGLRVHAYPAHGEPQPIMETYFNYLERV